MRPKRRPRVTRQILDGLTQAMVYFSADDLTDLPDEEDEARLAADEWIRQMWQFFPEEDQSEGMPTNGTP